jgi:predicted negative regulator of RcsB-dependent stress response
MELLAEGWITEASNAVINLVKELGWSGLFVVAVLAAMGVVAWWLRPHAEKISAGHIAFLQTSTENTVRQTEAWEKMADSFQVHNKTHDGVTHLVQAAHRHVKDYPDQFSEEVHEHLQKAKEALE